MSQIEDLQGRITAALDRISYGLETAEASGGADPQELLALRQQLEEEQAATAQLEERNKRMKDRLDEAEAAVERERASQSASLKRLDSELQALRRANAQLRENNTALREANQAGVAEPHLINKAMMAELESLRAVRGADRAETEAVLDELNQLLRRAEEENA